MVTNLDPFPVKRIPVNTLRKTIEGFKDHSKLIFESSFIFKLDEYASSRLGFEFLLEKLDGAICSDTLNIFYLFLENKFEN